MDKLGEASYEDSSFRELHVGSVVLSMSLLDCLVGYRLALEEILLDCGLTVTFSLQIRGMSKISTGLLGGGVSSSPQDLVVLIYGLNSSYHQSWTLAIDFNESPNGTPHKSLSLLANG